MIKNRVFKKYETIPNTTWKVYVEVVSIFLNKGPNSHTSHISEATGTHKKDEEKVQKLQLLESVDWNTYAQGQHEIFRELSISVCQEIPDIRYSRLIEDGKTAETILMNNNSGKSQSATIADTNYSK